jgi:hypothetical protein
MPIDRGGLSAVAKLQERSNSRLPPISARDILFLWPYFLYGLFYYSLLFADLIVAWTAHTEAASLALQFRGDYESAINLGLLAFIFQVEHSVALFYQKLTRAEQIWKTSQIELLRAAMNRFYWRRIARFVPFALVASAIPIVLSARFASGAPAWVIRWSLAAYPLLIVGLWNCSLLFGLASAPPGGCSGGLRYGVGSCGRLSAVTNRNARPRNCRLRVRRPRVRVALGILGAQVVAASGLCILRGVSVTLMPWLAFLRFSLISLLTYCAIPGLIRGRVTPAKRVYEKCLTIRVQSTPWRSIIPACSWTYFPYTGMPQG